MRALGAGLVAIGAIAAGLNFVRHRPDLVAPQRSADPPDPSTSAVAVNLEAIRSAGL